MRARPGRRRPAGRGGSVTCVAYASHGGRGRVRPARPRPVTPSPGAGGRAGRREAGARGMAAAAAAARRGRCLAALLRPGAGAGPRAAAGG